MEGDLDAGDTRYAHYGISIHSLRMEGDNLHSSKCIRYRHFNPLPPHGGRPKKVWTPSDVHNISIHSLRMEGDLPNGA